MARHLGCTGTLGRTSSMSPPLISLVPLLLPRELSPLWWPECLTLWAGLLQPSCLRKLLLQRAWCLQIGWDDILPDPLQQQWESWLPEVPAISQCAVPRCVSPPSTQVLRQTLHGYCDASCKAYGGVIYLYTVRKDTSIQVHLLTSKSKLTPIKGQTIPGLSCAGLSYSHDSSSKWPWIWASHGVCLCLERPLSSAGVAEDIH